MMRMSAYRKFLAQKVAVVFGIPGAVLAKNRLQVDVWRYCGPLSLLTSGKVLSSSPCHSHVWSRRSYHNPCSTHPNMRMSACPITFFARSLKGGVRVL
ncbi:hypothetical protein BKA82DRAFT_4203546, partial [Pisolithus tinctorius]